MCNIWDALALYTTHTYIQGTSGKQIKSFGPAVALLLQNTHTYKKQQKKTVEISTQYSHNNDCVCVCV